MLLTRHLISESERWAVDGRLLPASLHLSDLLHLPSARLPSYLTEQADSEQIQAPAVAPIDKDQEIWASGVTYLSSRMAREAESQAKDVYQKVYEAERPELFFKAPGWRVQGPGQTIRIRKDSSWNVPEPELTLVINAGGEIVGYTVGNDVSSRSIEGENPLYLPQAKVYDGSCSIGPGIRIAKEDAMRDLSISLEIVRGKEIAFEGQTAITQMKRQLEELSSYLFSELSHPNGVFLMTGTGIVPNEDFTLQSNDRVRIQIGDMTLENTVS